MVVYLTFFSFLLFLAVHISALRIAGLQMQKFVETHNISNKVVNSFFSQHRSIFLAIASICDEAQPETPPRFGDGNRKIEFKGGYSFVALGLFGITMVYLVFLLPLRAFHISDYIFYSDYIVFVISVTCIIELLLLYIRLRKFAFETNMTMHE